MSTRSGLLLALAFAVSATGCRRPDFTRPVESYLSLTRALQKGDAQTAWNGLSHNTQRILEERSKQISTESGGAVREDPAALFFGAGYERKPVKEVKILREEGNEATLSVVPEQGSPHEVRMVREDGRWKLDAGGALEKQVLK
jgi:hypothetical protein